VSLVFFLHLDSLFFFLLFFFLFFYFFILLLLFSDLLLSSELGYLSSLISTLFTLLSLDVFSSLFF